MRRTKPQHARVPGRLGLVIGALTLLAAAGCTKIQTGVGLNASNPWTVHGVLRVGSYEDLDNLNPLLTTQAFVSDVAQMVFSGLIDFDDHGEPIPDVALDVPSVRNGGISLDGKTITYHLRRDVKFSDGVVLTSADVKYTWQQILNPNNNVGYRYPYDQAVAVDTPDAYTVVVHLRAPLASFVAAFLRNGAIGSILPKHLLAQYSDLNRIPFSSKPVGSGPFIVTSWEPGSLLRLEPNPHYFRGPPKLREIDYRIITSQNTLLTDVMGHDLDLYYDAPEAQYSTLIGLSGYRVTHVPNMTYEHVDFNCGRPPFDDVRLRQAVAHAIDWKKLADDVYFGLDRPGMADTPTISWAYDPNVRPYTYDPKLARRLLALAGWTPGSNGLLQKGGQQFRIDIKSVAGVTSRAKAEQLIQDDLKAIGIGVDIHNYPANLLFATYGAGGILARGRFDLSLYAWTYTVTDPDDTVLMGPGELPPHGENYTFYSDPVLGRLEREGESHFERAQRRPYYWQIQERIHQEVPFHTIVWRSNIDIVNRDLKNFRPAPAVSDFWNSWQWQI